MSDIDIAEWLTRESFSLSEAAILLHGYTPDKIIPPPPEPEPNLTIPQGKETRRAKRIPYIPKAVGHYTFHKLEAVLKDEAQIISHPFNPKIITRAALSLWAHKRKDICDIDQDFLTFSKPYVEKAQHDNQQLIEVDYQFFARQRDWDILEAMYILAGYPIFIIQYKGYPIKPFRNNTTIRSIEYILCEAIEDGIIRPVRPLIKKENECYDGKAITKFFIDNNITLPPSLLIEFGLNVASKTLNQQKNKDVERLKQMNNIYDIAEKNAIKYMGETLHKNFLPQEAQGFYNYFCHHLNKQGIDVSYDFQTFRKLFPSAGIKFIRRRGRKNYCFWKELLKREQEQKK
jgi:hypothetical protein